MIEYIKDIKEWIMKNILKFGVIGLGGRGLNMMENLLRMDDIQVVAVCDLYADRAEQGGKTVEKMKGNKPLVTLDYKDILKLAEVDAIAIFTSWESHISLAIESMNAGKMTTMEVGGAYKLQDCWDLVDTYEKTKVPIMMLENCCYGEVELSVLNMVRQGVFGEIVHCNGGYMHDLRFEVANGNKNRHYRLRNYINRNCENYPTHELGPIAKVLDINRGNRLLSLTSTASKARGMHEYILKKKKDDAELLNTVFKQGDIVTTVIKCENGETITLVLDTTLPRTYSRGFTVRGTKGFYCEDNNSVFIDGKHNIFDNKPSMLWNKAKKYIKKYRHDMWKMNSKDRRKAGHGGMDYYVLRAMVEAFKNDTLPPIDVYDTALWMSITALSETSINNNSTTVEVPDFTRGKYKARTDKSSGIYCLDK